MELKMYVFESTQFQYEQIDELHIIAGSEDVARIHLQTTIDTWNENSLNHPLSASVFALTSVKEIEEGITITIVIPG